MAGKRGRPSLLEKAKAEAERAASLGVGLSDEARNVAGLVGGVGLNPAESDAVGDSRKRVARLPGGKSVALFPVSENPVLVKEAERRAYELDRAKTADLRREAEDGMFKLSHDEASELGWVGDAELKRGDIAWVANMLQVECCRKDAPSGIAWSLLAWARQETDKFFATVFSKLIPKEDEAEGKRRNRETHRTQVELFEQVEAWLGESGVVSG